jgi:hypothetical protein
MPIRPDSLMHAHIAVILAFSLLAGSWGFAQQSAAPGKVTPEERFFTAMASAGQETTTAAGGEGGTAFTEVFPDGGILVGFDVWLGPYWDASSVVKAICPIYETDKGRQRGKVYGEKNGSPVTVEAKPGDAVAALNIRTSAIVDGLRVQFQKIDYYGYKLTAASSYKSQAIGGEGGTKRVFPLTSNGRPIIGIHGGAGICIDRLGFIVADKK